MNLSTVYFEEMTSRLSLHNLQAIDQRWETDMFQTVWNISLATMAGNHK